ncbi:MAG TPA: hypothetical protein VGH82_01765 [Gaiellaceae bacterium]
MTDEFSNDSSLRELAHRVSGGIEVTLYWSADDDSTSVEIFHASTEQTLHFTVAREHALDAFYHPFAHLPGPVTRVALGAAGSQPRQR